MAGRILGMGDVVSLVEKAQDEVDEAEAEALAEKMMKGEFSMNDFIKQIKSIRRMGSMKSLLGMLPGVGKTIRNLDVDEGQFDRLEAMVNSMTPNERENAKSITKPRVRRISKARVACDDVRHLRSRAPSHAGCSLRNGRSRPQVASAASTLALATAEAT